MNYSVSCKTHSKFFFWLKARSKAQAKRFALNACRDGFCNDEAGNHEIAVMGLSDWAMAHLPDELRQLPARYCREQS